MIILAFESRFLSPSQYIFTNDLLTLKYSKMSLYKLNLSLLIMATTLNGLSAQESERQIASQTTEKTYRIKSSEQSTKNTVKIHTAISQQIDLAAKDEGKIDQKRVYPPKKITKTVLIDTDKDDAFDERIVFSYLATNSNADFTLVTNNDKVVVAIDDGDNLKILESESKLSKMEANKTAFVFTDQQGKEVEFFIESYDSLK